MQLQLDERNAPSEATNQRDSASERNKANVNPISESAVLKESGNATIAISGDQTGFSDRAGCTVSVKQLFDPFHQTR
jgi:hypothetical protein